MVTDATGIAHFPRVGLKPHHNRYYVVLFTRIGKSVFQGPQIPVPAPTVIGEACVATVQLKHYYPTLTGVLIDDEGHVLRNARFGVALNRSDEGWPPYSTRTDGEGRFHVPLMWGNGLAIDKDQFSGATRTAGNGQPWTEHRLVVSYRCARGSQQGIIPCSFVNPPGPGIHPVGRVQLKHTRLLASGQVVDGEGVGIPLARIWLQIKLDRSSESDETEIWLDDDSAYVQTRGLTDENGYFRLHSSANYSEVKDRNCRLAVSSTGFVACHSSPFSLTSGLPARNLKVVMGETPTDWLVQLKLPPFAEASDYFAKLLCKGRAEVRASAAASSKPGTAVIRLRGVSDVAQAETMHGFTVEGPLGCTTQVIPQLAKSQPSNGTRVFTADFSHHIERQISFHTKSGTLIPVTAIDLHRGHGSSWIWPPDEDGVFRFSAAPGAIDVRISLPPKGFDHLFGRRRGVREWKVSEPKGRITVE